MKLILASNSRTRKEILDKVGLIYDVIPSNIEEHSDKTDPTEYVMDLSKQKAQAKEMLKKLSGRVNYAVTGVTIIDLYQNKSITLNEVTEVYFDEITDEEIDWYIENEQYIFERCGYSIAGKSAIYISKINGDFYNILGMPISRVYKELSKLGYKLSDFK